MASGNTIVEGNNRREELFTDETVQLLAKGFMKNSTPALENVKKQLAELTDKQSALIERMHDQNLELSAAHHSPELLDIFNNIKIYQSKLVNIKKDMRLIHEKSTKLKKRALKLQQFSEKEQQEKEIRTRHEEELIAKPSTSSSK